MIIMKKVISSLIVIVCVFMIFTLNHVQAAEKYYYKGANYSTKITAELGKSYDSSSSVVIVSASAVFDGVSTGKERVRAFSRCEVVKRITNANTCYVESMSVRLAKSNSSGTDDRSAYNFITLATPSPTASTTYFSGISYLINNYYINATLTTIEAILNGMSYKVSHSLADYNRAARVRFDNLTTSNVDVPTTIKYNEVDSAYRKQAKGVGATFSFHDLSKSKFYVTASADANYVVDIPTGVPYQPPLVIGVKTAEAKVTHTIGN